MTISLLATYLRSLDGVCTWANAPLAPFTTISTGGKATLLATVASREALSATLVAIAKAEDRSGTAIPWTCLGAGSNLLIADEGYPGLLLKLDEGFRYIEGLPDRKPKFKEQVSITAGAGTHLSHLSTLMAKAGLSGVEFACGIPGSLGGAVAMNAGAHGSCLSEVVESIELIIPMSDTFTSSQKNGMTTRNGREISAVWLSAEDLHWGYRYCELPPSSVVTAVRIRVTAGDATEILRNQRELLRARRDSQPRGVHTFGSVFKNPPGNSAGRLLDEAGLKGMHWGGAEVSTVHANFISNTGDANTSDVLTLMGLMRQGVYNMSGFLLEPEVKLLGASFPWDSNLGASVKPIPRDNNG